MYPVPPRDPNVDSLRQDVALWRGGFQTKVETGQQEFGEASSTRPGYKWTRSASPNAQGTEPFSATTTTTTIAATAATTATTATIAVTTATATTTATIATTTSTSVVAERPDDGSQVQSGGVPADNADTQEGSAPRSWDEVCKVMIAQVPAAIWGVVFSDKELAESGAATASSPAADTTAMDPSAVATPQASDVQSTSAVASDTRDGVRDDAHEEGRADIGSAEQVDEDNEAGVLTASSLTANTADIDPSTVMSPQGGDIQLVALEGDVGDEARANTGVAVTQSGAEHGEQVSDETEVELNDASWIEWCTRYYFTSDSRFEELKLTWFLRELERAEKRNRLDGSEGDLLCVEGSQPPWEWQGSTPAYGVKLVDDDPNVRQKIEDVMEEQGKLLRGYLLSKFPLLAEEEDMLSEEGSEGVETDEDEGSEGETTEGKWSQVEAPQFKGDNWKEGGSIDIREHWFGKTPEHRRQVEAARWLKALRKRADACPEDKPALQYPKFLYKHAEVKREVLQALQRSVKETSRQIKRIRDEARIEQVAIATTGGGGARAGGGQREEQVPPPSAGNGWNFWGMGRGANESDVVHKTRETQPEYEEEGHEHHKRSMEAYIAKQEEAVEVCNWDNKTCEWFVFHGAVRLSEDDFTQVRNSFVSVVEMYLNTELPTKDWHPIVWRWFHWRGVGLTFNGEEMNDNSHRSLVLERFANVDDGQGGERVLPSSDRAGWSFWGTGRRANQTYLETNRFDIVHKTRGLEPDYDEEGHERHKRSVEMYIAAQKQEVVDWDKEACEWFIFHGDKRLPEGHFTQVRNSFVSVVEMYLNTELPPGNWHHTVWQWFHWRGAGLTFNGKEMENESHRSLVLERFDLEEDET